MAAILNYTTKIESEKTIGEIAAILVQHGATKISIDYANKVPTAVTFCLVMRGNMVGYALPANCEGVLRAMKNSRKIPNSQCNIQQAQRVAWRIVKDWVAAQCAIVQANVAELGEVFLPYAITRNGNTLWKEIQSNPNQLLLSAGN